MTISDVNISFADYDKKLYYKQIYDFDCGDYQINKFLTEAARHSCITKLVFIQDKLAAFVSYNCSSLEQEVIYNNEKQMENVPAIEIKVYGVDIHYQHDKCLVGDCRFSKIIFLAFLKHLQKIAKKQIYAKYFIVFSKKTSKNFLMSNGFQELPVEFKAHVNEFEKECVPMFAMIPEIDDV